MAGLRVKDWVEIKSADEILATLDENGCLDSLPFMPEMAKYCGRQFKVFKRVDKIIDVINKTGLRRMTKTVILLDLRCDGAAHGGCQAGCMMLWKEAWLRRRSRSPGFAIASPCRENGNIQSKNADCVDAVLLQATRRTCEGQTVDHDVYCCQATELYTASFYLFSWDPRQYLSPLFSGNVTLKEFLRGISIPVFNAVQRFRGGCQYPYWEGSKLKKTPTMRLDLQPGELVKVKSKEEIQKTLDTGNRNRGLWFDREMIRYCGGRFRVLRRVERIVDEKSGKLLKLRNPCAILDGVTTRGDYYRFNPQNDYILWRDIWLQRVDEHVDAGSI